ARHVKVVAAATDRAVMLGGDIQLLVTARRIEVVQDYFPDVAAHVRQTEAVAAAFAVVVHRGDERESIAPRGTGQRPFPFAVRQEVYRRDVEAAFAVVQLVAPPEGRALFAAAATGILP